MRSGLRLAEHHFDLSDTIPADFPALYTALDELTCLAEIKYHLHGSFSPTEKRFYSFLNADFSGSVLIIVGHETLYPDLVSKSDSGYPFCQAVAASARASGITARLDA